MRTKSEIERALSALSRMGTPESLAQSEVIEGRRTETWVFEHYLKNVPEEERNEQLFYAARDAAQYLHGKIGISALCAELDDEPEQPCRETITIDLMEYRSLISRIERIERRLGMKVRQPRKNISEASGDMMSQSELCRYIGCGKSTVKRWADKGLVTGYRNGYSVQYSRQEIDRNPTVQEYINKKNN